MPNIGIDQGFYEPSTGLSTNQLAFGTDKGNFFQNVTDAFGLTDYRKQNKAWEGAQDALGFQLGLSKDLASWYDKVIRPRQEQTLGRLGEYYDDASFSDEDYARTLGAASEDVAKSYGRARDATGRQLMSAGLDPSSGRYQSIISWFGRNQAATEAEARNAARAGLRDTEFARKGAALGLTGQSLSSMNPVGLSMSGAGQVGGIQSGLFSNLFGTNTGMMRRQQEDILGAAKSFGSALGGFADGKEVKSGRQRRKARKAARRTLRYADGKGVLTEEIHGEIKGSGTPVSDSIPVKTADGGDAALSDTEVVIPTDSVASIGLSMIKENPERAAHMLGVKVLEDMIDETHVPADIQRNEGLSVDPRGVEAPQEGYACGGEVKRKYADGGETGLNWKTALLNAATLGGYEQGLDRKRRRQAEQEELDALRTERERKDAYEGALSSGLDYARMNPDKTNAIEQIGLATEAYKPSLRAAQIMAAEDRKAEQELKEKELKLKYGGGEGAGGVAGWKPEEIDKQAFSMAARALGIDNMASMTPADEARVAQTAAAIRNEFMANPAAGMNNAYERFVSTREDPALREAAIAAATEEASSRNPAGPDAWRPEAMQRAYGGLTEQEWIERRAQEIYNQRRGLAPAAPQQDPLLAAMQARRTAGRQTGKRTTNRTKAPTHSNASRLARASAMETFAAVERMVEGGKLTPAMARAQLQRLEGIDNSIERNRSYDLRQLRSKLQQIANQGRNVGLSEVRG